MVYVTPEAIEYIRSKHPLQYGYRDYMARDAVYDPGDDPTVIERYNRCPNCEQWSPCDIRKLLEDVLSDQRQEDTKRILASWTSWKS